MREMVIEAIRVRWQFEDSHCSFKQLTGAEKCQCRQASTQRNQVQCGHLAWVSFGQHAYTLGKTIYQAHQQQRAPHL